MPSNSFYYAWMPLSSLPTVIMSLAGLSHCESVIASLGAEESGTTTVFLQSPWPCSEIDAI